MKDPYTREEIKSFGGWIRKTSKAKSVSKDDLKYKLFEYNFPDFVNNIRKYYVELEYSLPKCLKDFGLPYDYTLFLLEYLGIPKRSIREANNTKRVRDSYRQTCLDKYGVINISQVESVKKKKENSAIEKYGVINVFQAEEIKAKSKETMLEKYGVEHNIHRTSHPIKANRVSGIQKTIANIIKDLGYDIDMEVTNLCKAYNPLLKREYSPVVDIKLKNYDIIIEIYGDLWHANPSIYKESDIIPKYEGDTLAKNIWEFDARREEQIRNAGYDLIVVWEEEYYHNRQKIRERLKNEIENYINKKT